MNHIKNVAGCEKSYPVFWHLKSKGEVMDRYSIIDKKDKREIVLLKSFPCRWGRCSYCDYIEDNSLDQEEINSINKEVLDKVTGIYKKLEVINSASVFEIPKESLSYIKEIAETKGIETLVFEAYYNYRKRLPEIREFFQGINVEFKTGIESFDEGFREKFLKKGLGSVDIEEASSLYNTVCIMVGIEGQTKEMIERDLELASKFDRVCVNLFVDNSTDIKSDKELQNWFYNKYRYLEDNPKYDILWDNTDFGVGD